MEHKSLACEHPELLKEWDYEKNALICSPNEITAGSGKKVWWIGECGHEWEAKIIYRVKGGGCPYCSHQKLLPGFNDLKTLCPDVIKEWDYTKNEIEPDEIMSATAKKAWWVCPSGHSYLMAVCSKTRGRGCPICAKATHTSFPEQAIMYYIKQHFPDAVNADRHLKFELDIYIPTINVGIEYDGLRAHKGKKEKDEHKAIICKEKGIRLFRIREDRLDPLDDDYSTIINCKQNNTLSLETAICELLSCLGVKASVNITDDEVPIKELYDNFKKERSIFDVAPELIDEWHPTKNGKLSPQNVYAKTAHKYWWICSKGHEWQAAPAKRVSDRRGCPYCANQKVLAGFNDLETMFPEIAKEWSSRNPLSPKEVMGMSSKKYWWIGKCGHEWEAALSSRRKGVGCPYCAGQKVLPGFNDFESCHPELMLFWDSEKNVNEPIFPNEVTSKSGKKVWWKCPDCGNEWFASVGKIVEGNRCPSCANRRLEKPIKCCETDTVYNSIQEAARLSGVSASTISSCLNGRTKTAGGYRWEYLDR